MEAADNTAENPAETTDNTTENAPEVATDPVENADETPPADTDESGPATIISDTPPLTGHDLIDTLDKDGLELYARENFDREIDKRKRINTLREEVKALFDGTTQKQEAEQAKADAVAEARKSQTPVRARHKYLRDKKGNLFEFAWNPLFAKNADLEPIYED